jgi:hypothetical protein
MKISWNYRPEDLRCPQGNWKIRRAASFLERMLRIRPGSIVFVRPNGQRAKPDKAIGSLRTRKAA